ncbi:MAG: UDP-N-acetylmuramoyl-tripeptide--D-alanyl-D-alanine ligase [Lachnospiraceae bacterium]|nr:UDP-N-acetylmuramoyl-tripeptide--D-alanyl-D-alanine ligase [Lachnospiraceae bacterium]
MKNCTLRNITKAVSGTYFGPEENLDREIENACFDSRKIQKDGLFFATRGERTNGHAFLKDIYEKGALCAVTEREVTKEDLPEGMDVSEVSCIVVEDAFIAIRKLAAFYRKQLCVKVVGITGSVGKTSTKEMIAAVLSEKYNVLKTEKNHNNALGLSQTIFALRPEHEVAVLEMGISDFGEMALLASVARPDIGVITNIGQCHLENLGDRDGIFRAKTEFFGYLPPEGKVVLNGGDDLLAAVKNVCGSKPVFYNKEGECYATDIEEKGLLGSSCIIHTGEEQIRAEIPIPGRHQILNAMAAASVGKLLGLSGSQIEAGIRKTAVIDGRNKVIDMGRFVVIDDCYNANPVSMKAGLALLDQAKGRSVAVLGDMFELGDGERQLHRQVGEAMAQESMRPDVLVCIGDLAASIYEGAVSVSEKYLFATKEEFLEKMETILQTGDTILVKASHGMAFETLVQEMKKRCED